MWATFQIGVFYDSMCWDFCALPFVSDTHSTVEHNTSTPFRAGNKIQKFDKCCC